jgi:hypothetical protein
VVPLLQTLARRVEAVDPQSPPRSAPAIDGWTNRAHLFVWTKTADKILKKANRQTTSNAGH